MHIRKEEIMKLKKKSGLISAVIALSCASIVSVGFASWVISQGDTKTATGTIYVDEVSTKAHTITATWVASDSLSAAALDSQTPVVSYGPKDHDSTGWLKNNDGTIEALTFYLKVNVANIASDAEYSSKLSITMAAGDGYGTAASANLVGSLPALNATAGNGVGTIVKGTGAAGASDSWEAVYTISFKWGSVFNYQNPEDFYADKSAADYASHAQEKLQALNDALDGVGFTLTLVAAE